jgi:hypothetical protein
LDEVLIADTVDQPAGHGMSTGGRNELLLTTMVWLGVVVAAIVGYGCVASDRLSAIVYLIVVLPALVVSIGGSALARASGKPWPTWVKVIVLISTSAVMMVVAVLFLLVAALLMIWSVFVAIAEFCTGGR